MIHILSFLAMPFIVFSLLQEPQKKIVRRVIVLILFGLAMLSATIALSFPENTRHGYSSCAACHVSGSSGGGIPTAYGRSAGAEIMPTWNWALEIPTPDWLLVGGDVRYIGFWMQREMELGLRYGGLTVDAAGGAYGPDGVRQLRQTYVKLELPHVAMRAGRFIPSYGITFPDHRLPTRSGLGLGQGSETYNSEVTVSGSVGELTATLINGNAATIDATSDRGYVTHTIGRRGWAGRGALFIGSATQVGASVIQTTDVQAFGAHILTGTKRLFLVAEGDRRGTTVLANGKAGWEPFQGIAFGPTGKWNGDLGTIGAFATWQPVPHVEVSADVDDKERVLLVHYYM